jgi:hypothetical protein
VETRRARHSGANENLYCFYVLRALAAGSVILRAVAGARALQPHVPSEDLADTDLLQRIVMYLRSVHLPPVGLGDSGDLFLLAIRRRDQSVFGDLAFLSLVAILFKI